VTKAWQGNSGAVHMTSGRVAGSMWTQSALLNPAPKDLPAQKTYEFLNGSSLVPWIVAISFHRAIDRGLGVINNPKRDEQNEP